MSTPLIAYCCFGDPYARMLNLSLQSLLDLGEYRGRILVVSDVGVDELASLCPLIRYPTVRVVRVRTTHELAAKLARYRLHRWFDITVHAPVLYVDCDIIFDRPVAAALSAVESVRAVCFPSEPHSVAMWSSMGGNFLQADGLFADGCGFNSGTFGLPDGGNFRYFAHLEAILRTVIEFWTHRRHLFERWVDQPVVNYLQATQLLFDTDALTPFFRYCFQTDIPDDNPRGRTGAVHFFDEDKEGRMRAYLTRISRVPLSENMAGDL